MDENKNVNEAVRTKSSGQSPQESVPSPSVPPKMVKEAEHKLKEMSRKAKERKTAHNASKQSKGLSEVNYFWLVIGGLGALGVGYLVFGKKERQPEATRPDQRGPRQRPVAYAYVPKPKTPEVPVKEEVEKEEKTAPKFELNCF